MKKTNVTINGHQVLVLSIGRIVAVLFQFVLPMFLARILSQSGYGIYAQFNMLENLFLGTTNLALSSSIYYFFPRIEKSHFLSMLCNNLFCFFVASILLTLFLLCPFFQDMIMGESEIKKYIILLTICVFCSLCSQTMTPLYVVFKDNLTALVYPVLEIIIRATLVVMVALLIGGIQGVLIGLLLARLMMLLYVLIYIHKRTKSYYSPSIKHLLDLPFLKKQLLYSLPFAFSGALGTISGRIDKIICISYMSEEEYAIYAVAFLGIPGIQQVYSSIGEVSLTGMSQCFKHNDYKGALSILKNFEYKAVSFSFPIVLAVCLYADKIIPLIYSQKYSDSTQYFRAYIFYLLFEIMVSGLIVRASGKTLISTYTAIISFFIVVPISFISIKYAGAWGGIFSVMIGHLVQRIAYAFFEIKIVHSSWTDYLPWRQIGIISSISLLAMIPFSVLRYYWDSNIFFCGILAMGYIGIVYVFELYFNVFIVRKEDVFFLIKKNLSFVLH